MGGCALRPCCCSVPREPCPWRFGFRSELADELGPLGGSTEVGGGVGGFLQEEVFRKSGGHCWPSSLCPWAVCFPSHHTASA